MSRKRRSFWEPDNEVIKKWLKDQTDLGTSLELIIVDAIRKYGEGDVIRAYLSKRKLTPETVPEKPEEPKEVKVKEVSKKEASDPNDVRDRLFEDIHKEEKVEEYDPIKIMMGDTGSKLK